MIGLFLACGCLRQESYSDTLPVEDEKVSSVEITSNTITITPKSNTGYGGQKLYTIRVSDDKLVEDLGTLIDNAKGFPMNYVFGDKEIKYNNKEEFVSELKATVDMLRQLAKGNTEESTEVLLLKCRLLISNPRDSFRS